MIKKGNIAPEKDYNSTTNSKNTEKFEIPNEDFVPIKNYQLPVTNKPLNSTQDLERKVRKMETW